MVPTKSFVFFNGKPGGGAESLHTSFPYKGDLYIWARFPGSASASSIVYVLGKKGGMTKLLKLVSLSGSQAFSVVDNISATYAIGEIMLFVVIGAEGCDEIYMRTADSFSATAQVYIEGKFMFAG